MKSEITNVEPFNDIYTYDCFMNSLLCAAKHFKLNFAMITLHKTFFYSFAGGQLDSQNVIVFSIHSLVHSIGMEITKETDCIENWKEQYERDFKRGKIIIAPHDDYYNPLRKDIYGKEHLPHYTLIYGMDNTDKMLSVVESKYRETVAYKNMKLAYEDYEKSHFQQETLYRYVLNKTKCVADETYKERYLEKKVELLKQSLVNLQKSIDYLTEKKGTEIKMLLNNLNNICNQVKIEGYLYEHVFDNKDLSLISTEIFNTWYLIRTYVVKDSMMSRSDTVNTRIVKGIKHIEVLEKNKLNMLSKLKI